MDLNQLWQVVLGEMEVQLSRANFATWFKNSTLVEKRDDTCCVALPNNFAKEWIENKYCKALLGVIRRYDDSVKKIEFVVAGSSQRLHIRKILPADVAGLENQMGLELKTDPETNLNPRYTIKSFVVGSSNELAYAAATSIIQDIGKKYNPFFVYGGVGLGKTHLIQAIGNEIKNIYKEKVKPKYVSSEKFTSDIVWGIRNKRIEDVKRKYRDVDVLLIDDIQFIGGKEKTEEEFFHTFNALYENNKQIIISSDRPPQSIPTLEERLRSRFEGGLIADIGYPDYEMRVAIIKGKLQEVSQQLSDEVVDIIAKRVKKNVRELEGVLNKIIFFQERRGGEASVDVVEEIVEKSIQNPSKRVSEVRILKVIGEFFNIPVDQILSRSRRKEVVEPRQIAAYLLRDILDMSYPYIGEKLGRDHTTAIHAYEKINREINKNQNLNQKIVVLKELIYKE